MASSGSVVTSAYKGMKVRFYWEITATDIFNNSSTVKWTAVCEGSPSGILFPKVRRFYFSMGGCSPYSDRQGANDHQRHGINESFENGKTIDQWTQTVRHASNGDLESLIHASIGYRSESYTYDASYDGSIVLDHIPRASTFTLDSASKVFGGAHSAQITREHSDFEHSLDVKFYTGSGTTTYTVVAKTGSLQPNFTINIDWCSLVPNGTSLSADFILHTWYGDNIMGSWATNVTVSVPASVVPTLSTFTIAEATEGLAAQFGGYVEGKSTVAWSASAQGVYGSTIQSYEIRLPNQVYTTASGTSEALTGVSGNYNAVATVTDSRGRTATATIAMVIYPYGAPAIASFAPFRTSDGVTEDGNGTTLGIRLDLSAFDVNNRNPVSIGLGFRIAGSNGSFTALQHSIQANTYVYTGTQIFNKVGDPSFSIDNAYEIRLAITDYFGTTYKTASIATGITVFDISADGTGICFGGVAQPNEFRVVGKKGVMDGGFQFSGVAIASGEDLNDVIDAGFYFGDPGTEGAEAIDNCPAYGTPIMLEVFDAGAAAKMQRVTVCDAAAPIVFVRFFASAAWGAWVSV